MTQSIKEINFVIIGASGSEHPGPLSVEECVGRSRMLDFLRGCVCVCE